MDLPRKRSRSASSSSSAGSDVREVAGKAGKRKEEKKAKKEERKREKLEKRLRKLEGLERERQEREQQALRQPDRVRKMVLKVKALNPDNVDGVLAALCFIGELVTRISQHPDDLGIRRLGKECNGFRYVRNVEKGSSILQIVGFQKGQGSYLLNDAQLPLAVQAAEALALVAQELREELALANPAEFPVVGDQRLELARIATRNEQRGVRETPLTDVEAKCVGCFLGTACGDALGAPVETWSPDVIRKWFGQLLHFQDLPHLGAAEGGRGVVTGDTELLHTAAQSLVLADALDVKLLSEALAQAHNDEGFGRSYPELLDVILPLIVQGKDYRRVGTYLSPDGSQHNEGLTRVAAPGFAFRQGDDPLLMEAVRSSLLATTSHHDGIGAAFVLAKLLNLLLEVPLATLYEFDPLVVLKAAAASTTSNDVRARVNLVIDRAQPIDPAACPPSVPLPGLPEGHTLRVYTVSAETITDLVQEGVQQEAGEALGVALCLFVQYWQCPARGVVAAVMQGHETNTLAGIVGALLGALHGFHWLPRCWYDQLENNPKLKGGRDDLITLGVRVAGLGFDKPGKIKNKSDPLPFKKTTYSIEKTKEVKRQFGQKETIYSYG